MHPSSPELGTPMRCPRVPMHTWRPQAVRSHVKRTHAQPATQTAVQKGRRIPASAARPAAPLPPTYLLMRARCDGRQLPPQLAHRRRRPRLARSDAARRLLDRRVQLRRKACRRVCLLGGLGERLGWDGGQIMNKSSSAWHLHEVHVPFCTQLSGALHLYPTHVALLRSTSHFKPAMGACKRQPAGSLSATATAHLLLQRSLPLPAALVQAAQLLGSFLGRRLQRAHAVLDGGA